MKGQSIASILPLFLSELLGSGSGPFAGGDDGPTKWVKDRLGRPEFEGAFTQEGETNLVPGNAGGADDRISLCCKVWKYCKENPGKTAIILAGLGFAAYSGGSTLFTMPNLQGGAGADLGGEEGLQGVAGFKWMLDHKPGLFPLALFFSVFSAVSQGAFNLKFSYDQFHETIDEYGRGKVIKTDYNWFWNIVETLGILGGDIWGYTAGGLPLAFFMVSVCENLFMFPNKVGYNVVKYILSGAMLIAGGAGINGGIRKMTPQNVVELLNSIKHTGSRVLDGLGCFVPCTPCGCKDPAFLLTQVDKGRIRSKNKDGDEFTVPQKRAILASLIAHSLSSVEMSPAHLAKRMAGKNFDINSIAGASSYIAAAVDLKLPGIKRHLYNFASIATFVPLFFGTGQFKFVVETLLLPSVWGSKGKTAGWNSFLGANSQAAFMLLWWNCILPLYKRIGSWLPNYSSDGSFCCNLIEHIALLLKNACDCRDPQTICWWICCIVIVAASLSLAISNVAIISGTAWSLKWFLAATNAIMANTAVSFLSLELLGKVMKLLGFTAGENLSFDAKQLLNLNARATDAEINELFDKTMEKLSGNGMVIDYQAPEDDDSSASTVAAVDQEMGAGDVKIVVSDQSINSDEEKGGEKDENSPLLPQIDKEEKGEDEEVEGLYTPIANPGSKPVLNPWTWRPEDELGKVEQIVVKEDPTAIYNHDGKNVAASEFDIIDPMETPEGQEPVSESKENMPAEFLQALECLEEMNKMEVTAEDMKQFKAEMEAKSKEVQEKRRLEAEAKAKAEIERPVENAIGDPEKLPVRHPVTWEPEGSVSNDIRPVDDPSYNPKYELEEVVVDAPVVEALETEPEQEIIADPYADYLVDDPFGAPEELPERNPVSWMAEHEVIEEITPIGDPNYGYEIEPVEVKPVGDPEQGYVEPVAVSEHELIDVEPISVEKEPANSEVVEVKSEIESVVGLTPIVEDKPDPDAPTPLNAMMVENSGENMEVNWQNNEEVIFADPALVEKEKPLDKKLPEAPKPQPKVETKQGVQKLIDRVAAVKDDLKPQDVDMLMHVLSDVKETTGLYLAHILINLTLAGNQATKPQPGKKPESEASNPWRFHAKNAREQLPKPEGKNMDKILEDIPTLVGMEASQ